MNLGIPALSPKSGQANEASDVMPASTQEQGGLAAERGRCRRGLDK